MDAAGIVPLPPVGDVGDGDAEVEERVRLRPDASAAWAAGDQLVLSQGPSRLALRPVVEGMRPVVEALSGSGGTQAFLARNVAQGDAEAAAQLPVLLGRLGRSGWLERTLYLIPDGSALATLRPLANRSLPIAVPADPGVALILSRFALLRAADGEIVMESPCSAATVLLHDARLVALVAALARPGPPALLCHAAMGVPPAAVMSVLSLFASAGMVGPAEGPGSEKESGAALEQWSFTDLLFHARSRQGRHSAGYGATFPFTGRFPAPPDRKEPTGLPVPLPHIDRATLGAADPPFGTVLEARRSVRQHDDAAPITAEQLGELLYRAAGARPGRAGRAYPTGGALYELEVYPIVRRCAGLEAGLYHYDPHDHVLGLVAPAGGATDRFIEEARRRCLMEHPPQVLLVVTARFQRVSHKYESIAYATTLKNVGAFFQTLYCVATAMRLAPCAVGGGNADAFADAAGLDYYAETSVGEFIVGSLV